MKLGENIAFFDDRFQKPVAASGFAFSVFRQEALPLVRGRVRNWAAVIGVSYSGALLMIGTPWLFAAH